MQFFESAYQGSVLAFYLNANIHGRNVFFGMSTVRAMNVSQPPVNSTASLTEPLQVSLTWASPIVGVESDRRLPSVQTEMDRRSGGRVRQTDRQRQRDTNTETEAEQNNAIVSSSPGPFPQRRPSALRRHLLLQESMPRLPSSKPPLRLTQGAGPPGLAARLERVATGPTRSADGAEPRQTVASNFPNGKVQQFRDQYKIETEGSGKQW